MSKVCLFVLLALVACVSAQSESPVAPEPYSYGYETDSHAASEQRDPSGRVTGFYTLADADGRQRRVEYYADETGFHAKVQTNEVGTKSENPADVEIQAAPPTEQQFVVRAAAVQPAPAPAPAPQQFVSTIQQAPAIQQQSRYVFTQAVQQPQRSVAFVQQPASSSYGYFSQSQPTFVNTGYTTGSSWAPASSQSTYSSFNNHLPSQYYRSIQTSQPAVVSRYVSTARPAAPAAINTGSYRTFQTIGVPNTVGYSSFGNVPATVQGSNLQGSSNYLVLQKREAEYKKSK